MKAHDLVGYCSEEMTWSAAKSMGWTLTGSWKPCEPCMVAKAKQKNVPKEMEHSKAVTGENRIFLDIATVKRPKDGPKVMIPNWQIMVDERTGMKFSDFYASKTAIVEPTCEQWHKWKTVGLAVKYCRLDNAGENKLLQKRCNSAEWQLVVEFEFMARDTPQQNHLAELGFTVLANKGRGLMTRANVPMEYWFKLFQEAFKTATLLDMLLIVEIDGEKKLHVEHWSGNKPEYALNLHMWGEAGAIKLKTQMTSKLEDRGVQCMFIGYTKDHAENVYCMWDSDTSGIHETRDIIWLKRMYFEKPKLIHEVIAPVEYDADDPYGDEEAGDNFDNFGVREGESDDEKSEITDTEQADVMDEEEEEPLDGIQEDAGIVTRSGRAISKPTRLIEEMGACSYEIGLSAAEREYYNVMWKMGEMALVGAGIGGGFVDTNELHVMKYKEAMARKDAEKWQKAVDEEHE